MCVITVLVVGMCDHSSHGEGEEGVCVITVLIVKGKGICAITLLMVRGEGAGVITLFTIFQLRLVKCRLTRTLSSAHLWDMGWRSSRNCCKYSRWDLAEPVVPLFFFETVPTKSEC